MLYEVTWESTDRRGGLDFFNQKIIDAPKYRINTVGQYSFNQRFIEHIELEMFAMLLQNACYRGAITISLFTPLTFGVKTPYRQSTTSQVASQHFGIKIDDHDVKSLVPDCVGPGYPRFHV